MERKTFDEVLKRRDGYTQKEVDETRQEILDRIVFSPHIGGITGSSFRRGYGMIWDDIEKVAKGEVPGHIVNWKELEQ